ncbi:MAG TPA: alpha/beta hydrolase fold domain-containing protein [Lacunisphaera sp.]
MRLMLLGLSLFLGPGAVFVQAAPTPPVQPVSGPGGSDYPYARIARHSTGEGSDDATVFWPEQPTATGPLPVVVFTHGWGAVKPEHYEAWINHLVRRGAIVIYPRYQETLRVKPETFTKHAVDGVRRAVAWLGEQKSVPQPDPQRWATVGHSAGGVLAANLSIELPKAGLPCPKAVMSVEPGLTRGPEGPLLPLSDLSQMTANTLLLAVTGEDDELVGDRDARRIYEEAVAVPAAQKDLLQLPSDDHGSPALVATHRAPAAPLPGYEPPQRKEPKGLLRKRIAKKAKERLAERGLDLDASSKEPAVTDALDYYGTWKLFDALCTAAFENKYREFALGGGAAQLDMGRWSDDTPVKPIVRLLPAPQKR